MRRLGLIQYWDCICSSALVREDAALAHPVVRGEPPRKHSDAGGRGLAKTMTDWVPSLTSDGSPRYVAFVQALEADIAAGRVKPGMRLLPQREMAQRLALSVGTVSKAYAEAESRGLTSGEVGRGTFVRRRRSRN